MQDITSPAGLATINQNEPRVKTATRDTSGDFETFLSLLTTQMRNQDPLKPMESTEFVAQLASFSAVEQQVQTNEKLSHLIDLLGTSPATGLSDWIGKDVRHDGPVKFDGTVIDIAVKPVKNADEAYLVVRDVNSNIVFRKPINPTETNIKWSGEMSDGTIARSGEYQFGVEAWKQRAKIQEIKGRVFDRVVEARFNNNSIELVFANGTTILATDVTTIRMSP